MTPHNLKKIQVEGKAVQVESALRDGTGVEISTGKQNTLIPGTNIHIVNNVISSSFPVATSSAIGVVQIGTGLKIATDGILSTSKTEIGLGNVDNTSDVNKPISTATQTALDLKASTADLTSGTIALPCLVEDEIDVLFAAV